MGMKEDGPKRPNKRLLYYYGIILLITILLNALVMPALAERSVTEVTYDQFLDMLDEGQVAGVKRDSDKLTFWTKDVQEALNGQLSLKNLNSENLKIYKTGLWPDEDLTSRLEKAGISFTELYFQLGSANPDVCGHRPDPQQEHGETDGRHGKCHDLRKVQRQDLCGD